MSDEKTIEEKFEDVVNSKPGPIVAVVPKVPFKYNPNDPVSLYMDDGVFGQLQRVGKMMATSSLVPAHLQGKIADCALIAAQAFRWKMDPFAVAQASYVTSGKVGYEGKLIAALINSSPKLAGPLSYEYSGSGDDRKVVVSAKLKGEDKPRPIDGTIRQWKQERNSKWREMPDQMLAYRGAREWARRHLPEVVLGVYSIDEVEEIEAQEAKTELPEALDAILTSSNVEAKDDPKTKEKKVVSALINSSQKEVEEKPVQKRRGRPPKNRIVQAELPTEPLSIEQQLSGPEKDDEEIEEIFK